MHCPITDSAFLIGAHGGIRTHIPYGRRILSPLCIPVPPHERKSMPRDKSSKYFHNHNGLLVGSDDF